MSDDGIFYVTLGSAVRAARRAMGLKQQELAWASGVSRSTIQRVEAGGVTRWGTVARLAAILGLDVNTACGRPQ